ncbi:MAG TPA: hypothetical protein VF756_26745 [Thermoanaerobaculia bacterium]
MSRIKIWNRVPDRSQLHVQVEGGEGAVDGFYMVSDGTTEEWSDGMLRAGQTRSLRTPNTYNVGLVLRFAGASTMTVKAHVEKPGGSHHGDDYEEPVTGAAGDVKAVAIGAVTLQS